MALSYDMPLIRNFDGYKMTGVGVDESWAYKLFCSNKKKVIIDKLSNVTFI